MITKKCLYCGKEFQIWPYRIREGTGKFCSHKCYGKNLIGKKGRPWSQKSRKKLSQGRQGPKHPRWKGGSIIIKEGRIKIWKPEHPFCDGKGYVRKSRLIMEKKLGRYLVPQEVVHHINGKVDDDRLKNLLLFKNQKEHLAHHRRMKI